MPRPGHTALLCWAHCFHYTLIALTPPLVPASTLAVNCKAGKLIVRLSSVFLTNQCMKIIMYTVIFRSAHLICGLTSKQGGAALRTRGFQSECGWGTKVSRKSSKQIPNMTIPTWTLFLGELLLCSFCCDGLSFGLVLPETVCSTLTAWKVKPAWSLAFTRGSVSRPHLLHLF